MNYGSWSYPFKKYKDVTSDLKEAIIRIYGSETKVGLPSKIAKFCGNICKLIGEDLESTYRTGQSRFWDIPEIEFFDRRKPWPYEYKMIGKEWKLVERKFSIFSQKNFVSVSHKNIGPKKEADRKKNGENLQI